MRPPVQIRDIVVQKICWVTDPIMKLQRRSEQADRQQLFIDLKYDNLSKN